MHAVVKKVKSCLLKLLNKLSSFKQQKGPSMWSIGKKKFNQKSRTNELNRTEFVIVYPKKSLCRQSWTINAMQCRGGQNWLTILSKAILFSSHLGKPSIRTLLALLASIAFLMSSTVISDGTILPSLMMSTINSLKCKTMRSVEAMHWNSLHRKGIQRWTGGDDRRRSYDKILLPFLTARCYFMAQKVTSAQMGKSEIWSNLGALCSFATARTPYREEFVVEWCDYAALNQPESNFK